MVLGDARLDILEEADEVEEADVVEFAIKLRGLAVESTSVVELGPLVEETVEVDMTRLDTLEEATEMELVLVFR